MVDFVRHWSERSEICYEQLLQWIQLSSRKFRDWRSRYGKANEHNHLVPATMLNAVLGKGEDHGDE